MNSSLDLSAVVLDVDRTLIRSVRNRTPNNPYPYYKSQHVEEYFHFTLSHEPKRSHSISSSQINTKNSKNTHTKPFKPSFSNTLPSKNRSNTHTNLVEHYHIYIRPGLKKLMTYLSYLQQKYSHVKIVIASMAKRDYINSILRGLKKHCSERKFPKFDSILTRESWDENLSPSSTPTYPINVLLEQYAKHGFTKQLNLRFKSINKIAETLHIPAHKMQQILVVDDDMGYYDHEDRVSGQIYQIPAWNGPINHSHRRNNHQNITIYVQSDNELPSLGAMIQAIVDKGSIQKYLFTRVLSVFRHEYGSRYKKQMRLRKSMMNILMHDIGMEIDEDTAISSLWIFDNILRCCVADRDRDRDRDRGGSGSDNDSGVLDEYIEILFGCIIVYQMYIYDVHPSAHFYRLSFTQNEFWKQVMDVFFEYYVRLLFHINDSRIQPKKRVQTRKKSIRSQVRNHNYNFISITNLANEDKNKSQNLSNVSENKRKSIITKTTNNPFFSDVITCIPPIEVAQSEPELLTKCDIIAQEEVIIGDSTPIPNTNDNIILTQQVYKSIQDNLKVLVKSISSSIFCKNLSPVCFIGYNLLSASRENPVPKCISKYQRILKKVYRDRNRIDL